MKAEKLGIISLGEHTLHFLLHVISPALTESRQGFSYLSIFYLTLRP